MSEIVMRNIFKVELEKSEPEIKFEINEIQKKYV